jgi:F-type H+-transporting ATPase subunit c
LKFKRKSKGENIMSSTILVAIGAGIAVLTGIGAGLGIGKATAASVDAIARQPEAAPKIQTNLLLGCALAEATAIYGFVIALLIIMVLK